MLYSPNDFVRSAAIADDTLYVAGDFIDLGPPTGPAAVLDKASGEADLSQVRLDTGAFSDGGIRVILPDGAGGWYVGGTFYFAGGEPRRNLAHVLADGSLDPDFTPDPLLAAGNAGYLDRVRALVLSDDGRTLYIGGRFDTVGGRSRQSVAAVNAQTGAVLPLSVATTYQSTTGAIGVGEVAAMVYHRGVLYFGGDLSTVNGMVRTGAAAVNATTGALLAWDLGIVRDPDSVNGVFSMGVGPPPGDSTLYIGGLFVAIRGLPRLDAAEVTLADPVTGEGGVPTAWTTPRRIGGGQLVVTETTLWESFGRISRATGAFTEYTAFRSGAFRGRGGAVAFDPTGGPSGQGVAYVAANQTFPGDPYPSQFLLALNAVTGQPLPGFFDPAVFGGGALRLSKGRSEFGVRTLAVEPGPGGRLFVGGDGLYGVGRGTARRFLAGLDLTTGRPIPFAEDYVIFSSVEEVAISPDARYLYFETFNGLGVADLQTGVITAFPGTAALAARQAAWAADAEEGEAPQAADDRLRRAGPVAAFADGRPLTAYIPPARAARSGTASGGAYVVTDGALVAGDDRLYVYPGGGVLALDRFTGAEIWATPLPSFSTAPTTEELLLVEGGPPGPAGDTLFAAGAILSGGGEPRDRFAALDAETGAVLAWNVNPTGPGNGVGQALAVLEPSDDSAGPGGGRVYLSGSGLFTIGGEPRRDLAAADRTTGDVLDWRPALSVNRFGGSSLAAQAGPEGGIAGGVVYTGGFALDAETGAELDWALEPVGTSTSGGGVVSALVSPRHGRVVLSGTFGNSLRGSGHAFVTALSPARPFPVAGESGPPSGTPSSAALAVVGANPARSASALSLSLPKAGVVTVSLYDVLGRRVAVLHAGPLAAGVSRIVVEAVGLPTGLYVARAVGDSFAASVTLTVVR